MQTMFNDLDDKLGGAPHSKQSLRLWLRLLTCTTMLERRVREKLRTEFNTTLPRFDFLAALERAPKGLTMGQISERLMVSNGNVTGLATRLEQDGFIIREVTAPDRRTQCVKLTAKGRREFQKWAKEHEMWIDSMLAELSDEDMQTFMALLQKARLSLRHAIEKETKNEETAS